MTGGGIQGHRLHADPFAKSRLAAAVPEGVAEPLFLMGRKSILFIFGRRHVKNFLLSLCHKR